MIGIAFIIVFVLVWIWIFYQLYKAPILDENENLVEFDDDEEFL